MALALTGRDPERLAAVAAACGAGGAAVEWAAIDVTDRERLRGWIEDIDDRMPLELVVANAGISAATGRRREDEAAARRVLATNIDGVLNTVFPVLPRMMARRAGADRADEARSPPSAACRARPPIRPPRPP